MKDRDCHGLSTNGTSKDLAMTDTSVRQESETHEGAQAADGSNPEPVFREMTCLDPVEQMRRSALMLEEVAEEPGALIARVFTWDRVCISRGLRQNIEHLIDVDEAVKRGIPIVERPTGGMLAFHGKDLAFGVAISLSREGWSSLNVDAIARRVNGWIATALNELGFPAELPAAGSVISPGPSRADRLCAASRTDSDILLNGKKLLGASMRKKRGALLYEATLPLEPPPAEALTLLKDEAYRKRILTESTALSEVGIPPKLAEIVHSLVSTNTL